MQNLDINTNIVEGKHYNFNGVEVIVQSVYDNDFRNQFKNTPYEETCLWEKSVFFTEVNGDPKKNEDLYHLVKNHRTGEVKLGNNYIEYNMDTNELTVERE